MFTIAIVLLFFSLSCTLCNSRRSHPFCRPNCRPLVLSSLLSPLVSELTRSPLVCLSLFEGNSPARLATHLTFSRCASTALPLAPPRLAVPRLAPRLSLAVSLCATLSLVRHLCVSRCSKTAVTYNVTLVSNRSKSSYVELSYSGLGLRSTIIKPPPSPLIHSVANPSLSVSS